jgi:hypothetical protein
VKESSNGKTLIQKMKDYREETSFETKNKEDITLRSEILDLKLDGEDVSGVFSKDFVRRHYFRRKLIEEFVTEEAPFWIKSFKESSFLISMAPSVARGVKKLLTNHVANKLSEIVFNKVGSIVEVEIPHTTLKELHESNPQATKLIWFDGVDIPGVEKLCLAGSDLADTALYHNYLDHGKIWYVVFGVQKRSIVVGITRNCVVTLFSESTTDDFVNYISEDLLSLVR